MGRGLGLGADYRAWLTAREVPSRGYTYRIKGNITGRSHVLFSTFERDLFVWIESLGKATDIREQFPLLPLSSTLEIAEGLRIKHPRESRTDRYKVFTTDLVVFERDGSKVPRVRAIAFKPSSEINKPRTIEKDRVEDVWWSAHGLTCERLTEKDLPPFATMQSLLYVHPYFHAQRTGIPPQRLAQLEETLLQLVSRMREAPLMRIASKCDECFPDLPLGSSLTAARHFVACRRWVVDHNLNPVHPADPLILKT